MKQRPIIESMGWFYAPKYWKHYDDLHKNITDDSKLPRFYQEIVDDWIQEDEPLKEDSKVMKYLGMFEKLLKKRR
jgi:hypothetical protein